MHKMANISQSWLELLVPFTYEYDKKFTGSEVSRITRVPQRTAARHLDRMVRLNLIRIKIRGRNKFYYFDLNNERSKILLNFVESYKSLKFSLKTDLWRCLEKFSKFGTLILFGSYAKGYATKSSDIDLVIFAKKTKEISSILHDFPKVNAHFLSISEFGRTLKSGNILAVEIVKSHVIFGEVSQITDIFWRFYKK